MCDINPKRTCMNLFKTPRRLFRQLLALTALAVSPEVFATTVNVNINPTSFTPDPVVINVNDSVKWTWGGYVVQRSANLSGWVSLKTNVASGSSVLFQDTNASFSKEFHRVFQTSP